MAGHRPFGELRKRKTPARRARNAKATKRMLAGMARPKGATRRKIRRPS